MQFDAKNPEPFRQWFEEQVKRYNQPAFIIHDPISIPHRFTRKEDIEIAGFFAALLAWGNRTTILRKASELMERMDNAPAEYVLSTDDSKYISLQGFVHRTFNADDIIFLVEGLHRIYQNEGGLEAVLTPKTDEESTFSGIIRFRQWMLKEAFLPRHKRLIPNPAQGSAAKRLNMFLRWVIRKDRQGVDFGLWQASPSSLMCPLDVHSGRMARQLGLLHRKQDDWKAVEELTENLRLLDPDDPVKYDFALFGLSTDSFYDS
ncbi:MAG: TIGR02757 family protein [Bacteroidales bacterium]